MKIRENLISVLVTLLGGCIAYHFSMMWTHSGLVAGEYIPVSHDSFYHARRFIDFLSTPRSFYQFDTKIHAQEGSWLTWPWAYTFTIGHITLFLSSVFKVTPEYVLWRVPVAFVLINTVLIAIVCKRLNFSNSRFIIAICFFAFSPLTQGLHGFGVLDHHYIEYTFVLASLCCGLFWLDIPEKKIRAIIFGIVLGIAPAFHNSLFILQAPLLLTLLVAWYSNKIITKQSMIAIALTLSFFTLLAVLPSEPFLEGQFSFYTLSWFHLFVSICTSLIILYVAFIKFSRKSLYILIIFFSCLYLIVFSQLNQGFRFFHGEIGILKQFGEIKGGFEFIYGFGWKRTASLYSYLFFLIPFSIFSIYYLFLNDKRLKNIYFLLFSLLGIFLLWQQFRLHYYGSFALYLPLLLVSELLGKKYINRKRVILLITICISLLAYQPVFSSLLKLYPIGLERDYELTRDIYPHFKRQCNKDPGIVLALPNDGHYIRFHTSCSVIANNFLISKQHEEKVKQVFELLSMPILEIKNNYPWIKYIYVHNNYETKSSKSMHLLDKIVLPIDVSVVLEKKSTLDNGDEFILARIYKLN